MVRRHFISFKHAAEGILHAVTTQPNFIVHFIISSLVVSLGMVLHLSFLEWGIIVMIIGIGLAIELINTSIESVVDLATEKWHKSAKIAKDTAAAAMLIYAIASTIFAVFLFLPKI